MLSNAYFLAKFRFDTAENEPDKNFQKLKYLLIFPICGELAGRPSAATAIGTAETEDTRSGGDVLRLSAATEPARYKGLGLAKLTKLAFSSQNFAIFWRARSRLYLNEILQENIRLKALLRSSCGDQDDLLRAL